MHDLQVKILETIMWCINKALTCKCVVHIKSKELDLLQHETSVHKHSGNCRDFKFSWATTESTSIRHLCIQCRVCFPFYFLISPKATLYQTRSTDYLYRYVSRLYWISFPQQKLLQVIKKIKSTLKHSIVHWVLISFLTPACNS